MKKTILTNYSRAFLLLIFFFLINGASFGQDSSATVTVQQKPRIVFSNPGPTKADSLRKSSITVSDSASRPRITFKKSLILDENKIVLLSEDRFSFNNAENPVGPEGEILKKVMSRNPEALKLVDEAYGKKTQGTVLMVIGGAIAVASLALQSTWIETQREQHGNVTYTQYWIPGITIGGIIGALGYVQFSSVYRRLNEAVDYFNSSLK